MTPVETMGVTLVHCMYRSGLSVTKHCHQTLYRSQISVTNLCGFLSLVA